MPASDRAAPAVAPEETPDLRRFAFALAWVVLPVLAALALLNWVTDPFGYRERPLDRGLNDVRSEVFYRAARPTQMHWLRTQAQEQNSRAELLIGTSRVVRGFDACAHPHRGTLALPMMSQDEMASLVVNALPPPDFEQTVWIEIARGANFATGDTYGSKSPNRDDLFSWNAAVTGIANWATSRHVLRSGVQRSEGGNAGCYVPPLEAAGPLLDSVGLLREQERDPESLPAYRDLLARLAPACGPNRKMVLAVLPVYLAKNSWDEALTWLERLGRAMTEETAKANARFAGCRFEYRDLASFYLKRGFDAQQADVAAGRWVDGVHFVPALGEDVLNGN